MNSRERTITALNHKEPDCIPLDLGGTIVSSIAKNAYVNLKKYLGIKVEDVKILDHVQQLPYLDEELLRKLGVDVRMVRMDYDKNTEQKYIKKGDYYYYYDRWGAELGMPKNGHYFDYVGFPINHIYMKELDDYKWPELDDKELIQKLKQKAKFLYESTDYALTGTAVFGGGVFEQPARIMGMERFLTSIALDKKFANKAMEKVTELYIENCRRYLDEIGKYIQVFVYWNDISGQRGPLISPEIYRRLIKPKDKRIIMMVKSRTDAKVFYHCCGAIRDFIPDFIEIGVDILNPVQVSAAGMDTADLKKRFGNDISFWGGGCDTQRILPFGTPDEIREEVRRRIGVLAEGGGFVFSTVHNIQNEVPPENIIAMFEAFNEFRKY
jgi:uroporphyrinogen decarboxylase